MPAWDKICDAYGLPHVRCERTEELPGVLAQMLAREGPVFVECCIPENVELFPAVTSRKREDGTFVSSRLHEMSPQLSAAVLAELGVTGSLLAAMNGTVR